MPSTRSGRPASARGDDLPDIWQPSEHGRITHFEYDVRGREVWVSVWDKQGEIIVYDDKTLTETHRIRGGWLVTPTGKFNAYNTANDVY